MVIIQLKDDSNLKALQRAINSITFEYEDSHGRVYDNDSRGYVDAFEKYQIEGALYPTRQNLYITIELCSHNRLDKGVFLCF